MVPCWMAGSKAAAISLEILSAAELGRRRRGRRRRRRCRGGRRSRRKGHGRARPIGGRRMSHLYPRRSGRRRILPKEAASNPADGGFASRLRRLSSSSVGRVRTCTGSALSLGGKVPLSRRALMSPINGISPLFNLLGLFVVLIDESTHLVRRSLL